MKKWIGRIILIAIVAAIVAGVVHSMRPKPLPVDTRAAETGPMRVSVDAEGRTRVKDRYVVMATVHGNLARIELNTGDWITEETVLARIEPTAPPLLDTRQIDELRARARASEAAARQAGAAVGRAQTSAEFAVRSFERTKELYGKGALSQQDFDAAQLEAEAAGKELASAQFGARVAKYEREMAHAAAARATQTDKKTDGEQQIEIHSPITGRVLRILRESEGIVQPGESLVELGDPAALEIVADILTADSVQIDPGDSVSITQWGGDVPLEGHVSRIEPAAFTKISALGVEEQRVNVVIELDDAHEKWGRLGDGFRVEVDVTVWEGDGVLKAPVSALFRDGESWAVFLVEEDRAQVRRIEIEHRNDFEVEVTGGITPGEVVIVHPSDNVAAGVLVETR